jgi:hypothetical protein
MDYAEAINRFNDEVASALSRGEARGLTDKEMAEELMRMAKEIDVQKK